MKNVRIADCTIGPCHVFTRGLHTQCILKDLPQPRKRKSRPKKVQIGRVLGSRAKNLFAVQSVPGEIELPALAAKEFCQTACMRRRVRLVRQDCMSKGDDHLPLLKSQPKQPKSATIQIRVEEDVKLRLDKYAEFIDSSAAYVFTEALKLLFNKDGEFRSWLGQNACNAETQRQTSKTTMSKGESVQLALR